MNFIKRLIHDSKIVYSPVSGKIVPLEKVEDPVFSEKLIGDGVTIEPENGSFFAPIDGVITFLFPTKHAVGIQGKDGTDILIHIGLDTVNLKGNGFHPFIKKGVEVHLGQKIMEVNLDAIRAKGFSLTTMVIVTNKSIREKTDKTYIKKGEKLFIIYE